MDVLTSEVYGCIYLSVRIFSFYIYIYKCAQCILVHVGTAQQLEKSPFLVNVARTADFVSSRDYFSHQQ